MHNKGYKSALERKVNKALSLAVKRDKTSHRGKQSALNTKYKIQIVRG